MPRIRRVACVSSLQLRCRSTLCSLRSMLGFAIPSALCRDRSTVFVYARARFHPASLKLSDVPGRLPIITASEREKGRFAAALGDTLVRTLRAGGRMGTRITLNRMGAVVLDSGTGRSRTMNAHAPESAPTEQPDPPVRDASPPREAAPGPDHGLRPGIQPGRPKTPPRVMLVASALHSGDTESWGPGFRRTRKVLPFAVEWEHLTKGSSPQLGEALRQLSESARQGSSSTQMLNVLISERDIAGGLDLDEVRTRTRQLAPGIRGFNIFYAPKGEWRGR